MADLPTNLKDDILDSSVNTRRKYRMIENGDGTYSFEDATEYNQVGDEYGAGLINETNRQVNARVEKAVVVRDLETIGAITQEGFIPDALALKDVNDSLTADNAQAFQFAYDSTTQKYGYKVKEADTEVFVPFKSGGLPENREEISGTTNKDYALVQVFSIDVYSAGSATCDGGTLIHDNYFADKAGSGTDIHVQEKFYADVPQGSTINIKNSNYSFGKAFGYY